MLKSVTSMRIENADLVISLHWKQKRWGVSEASRMDISDKAVSCSLTMFDGVGMGIVGALEPEWRGN